MVSMNSARFHAHSYSICFSCYGPSHIISTQTSDSYFQTFHLIQLIFFFLFKVVDNKRQGAFITLKSNTKKQTCQSQQHDIISSHDHPKSVFSSSCGRLGGIIIIGHLEFDLLKGITESVQQERDSTGVEAFCINIVCSSRL